jgi:uncharacterized phage protein (TIGR02220 family)
LDYFKHYSTASDSKLINYLFDEYRHTGYAYWFLLLELCAENWDGKSAPSFKFHTRIVRQKLRISLQNLELFLTKCSTFSDIKFKLSKKELEIEIPKLLEVKTSRSVIKSNKKQLTVYKEIDKEIDKDTTKPPSKKSPPALFEVEPLQLSEEVEANDLAVKVLTAFNTICFKGCQPTKFNLGKINARIKEGYSYEDFVKVITFKNKQWKDKPEMREHIHPSTFFCGKFDGYLQAAISADRPVETAEDETLKQAQELYQAHFGNMVGGA